MTLGWRSWTTIAITSVAGVLAFCWPFIAGAESGINESPWVFMILIPLLIVLIFAQLSDGDMDAKSIAILGVLAAVIAVLRPLGGGAAGIEPIWFVIVIAGRALGPGFGFTLGTVSLLASALLTGGVGPWLPFQMIAAGWVGLGAGFLPRASGVRNVLITAAYGGIAALAYGLAMNLWFWPMLSYLPDAIAFDPTADASTNLVTWLTFSVTTSLGFDIPRAVLTVALILIAGQPLMKALERLSRKAAFATPRPIATITK